MWHIFRANFWSAWWVGASLVACLPKDTRPAPSSVLVTMTPGDQTLNGVALTADGWKITFDRFLLSAGGVSVDGSSCLSYSEARYLRVFDALVPGTQKLSESFAFGQCDIGFRVSNPQDDSLLASGVRPADLAFMRTPGMDAYAGLSGISIYVQGHAQHEDVKKAFTWAYRQQLNYTECAAQTPMGKVRGLTLAEGGAATIGLEIHGEALFNAALGAADAQLRFAEMADADTSSGNGDGDITMDELAQVQLSDIRGDGNFSAPSGSPDVGKTLRDYLYLGAFPEVVRFTDNGTCTTQTGQGD